MAEHPGRIISYIVSAIDRDGAFRSFVYPATTADHAAAQARADGLAVRLVRPERDEDDPAAAIAAGRPRPRRRGTTVRGVAVMVVLTGMFAACALVLGLGWPPLTLVIGYAVGRAMRQPRLALVHAARAALVALVGAFAACVAYTNADLEGFLDSRGSPFRGWEILTLGELVSDTFHSPALMTISGLTAAFAFHMVVFDRLPTHDGGDPNSPRG